jgi:hypothetical protein
MAGFFDWLTSDGSPDIGTYLMSVLDPEAKAKTPKGGTTPGIGSSGLPGNSPLGNAIRGGLAGFALQGVGGGSLGKFGAGALAAQQLREQRDRQRVQDLMLARRLQGEDAADAWAVPKVGDEMEGHVFLGGWPGDPNNWREVGK